MVVMNGGLIPAGQLLTHLTFYHRMHYIHASRYRDNEGTNELDWKFKPDVSIEGEHVLLIDDIEQYSSHNCQNLLVNQLLTSWIDYLLQRFQYLGYIY